MMDINEIKILALTHIKLVNHLEQSSLTETRRREQLRVQVALRKIREWENESRKEIENER